MHTHRLPLSFAGLVLVLESCLFAPLEPVAAAEPAATTAPAPGAAAVDRYTFSWPITADPALGPRGGTTRGPQITLEDRPSEEWRALQEPGLTPFERDRRAILTMAGGYRATFDFLEVLDFRETPRRERPYQSWGTEVVLIAEDRGDFISLQHVLVMQVVDRDGRLSEPYVSKHWRQDWTWQDRELVEYVADETWQRRTAAAADVAGTWSQAVYQVDDSPRYESIGRWQHTPQFSTWLSAETARPLPRREWSVRKDYNVLVGTNRHTVLPTGWVQEENNLKGTFAATPGAQALPFFGREYGVARYQRTRGYDFSPGERYFKGSQAFWNEVRAAWERRFAAERRIGLVAPVDEANLFVPFFQHAEKLVAGDAAARLEPAAERAFIEQTLDGMIRADGGAATRAP